MFDQDSNRVRETSLAFIATILNGKKRTRFYEAGPLGLSLPSHESPNWCSLCRLTITNSALFLFMTCKPPFFYCYFFSFLLVQVRLVVVGLEKLRFCRNSI